MEIFFAHFLGDFFLFTALSHLCQSVSMSFHMGGCYVGAEKGRLLISLNTSQSGRDQGKTEKRLRWLGASPVAGLHSTGVIDV